MSESKISQPTSSYQLPNKVAIDFNNGKWYTSPQKKSKQKSSNRTNKTKSSKKSKDVKSPGIQEKIDKYFSPDRISDSPTPKKRRVDSNSKIFKKHKYLSPSAKMEPKIPKVEDLLRDREESIKFKEIDKLIKKSSTQFLKELIKDNLSTPEKQEQDQIDCKHLTLNQLERRFRKNVNYLDGVFNGSIYSKRHELFQKHLLHGNNTLKEDLRVSESLGVFTSDQLVYIVSLFRERYDDGNKYKYSDYYFKVLLPEYCLKLFVDCHKMSNEEALEYLKNVPVPDLFGLMS